MDTPRVNGHTPAEVHEYTGRVLEAGVSGFTVACFRLEDAPPLGALVVVDDGSVLGVVSDVRTEGRDPGRRPVPHGGPEDDRARVLARNPQIPALLQTVFEATVTGFGEGDDLRQRLPPAPPPVYARVRICTPDEVAVFSQSFDCCALLLASGPLADEVTAAYLRRAASVQPNPRAYLVSAGKALTVELAADADRLAALLRRLRP